MLNKHKLMGSLYPKRFYCLNQKGSEWERRIIIIILKTKQAVTVRGVIACHVFAQCECQSHTHVSTFHCTLCIKTLKQNTRYSG